MCIRDRLYRGELPARDRELLILRTAWNTGAEYEWGQHVHIARTAGVGDAEISRVIDGPEAAGWTSMDSALLRAADELHGESTISDATWGVLAGTFDEHQLICLLYTSGSRRCPLRSVRHADSRRRPH